VSGFKGEKYGRMIIGWSGVGRTKEHKEKGGQKESEKQLGGWLSRYFKKRGLKSYSREKENILCIICLWGLFSQG